MFASGSAPNKGLVKLTFAGTRKRGKTSAKNVGFSGKRKPFAKGTVFTQTHAWDVATVLCGPYSWALLIEGRLSMYITIYTYLK